MRNFKYLLIIVAAVMLFASCSDDGDDGVPKSLEGEYFGTITETRIDFFDSEGSFERVRTHTVTIGKNGEEFFLGNYPDYIPLVDGKAKYVYNEPKNDLPPHLGKYTITTTIEIVQDNLTFESELLQYNLDLVLDQSDTSSGVLKKQ